MASKNVWIKAILAISYYVSCFVFVLILINGSVEIFEGNEVPVRLFFLGLGVIINWLVLAYASEEVYWRTLIKLVCYSLALFSLFIFMLGLLLIIKNFYEVVRVNMINALFIALFGALSIYGFVKIGNAKWLNR